MSNKVAAALAAFACCALTSASALAATIFETAEIVANTTSADAQLPDAIAFEVTTAGSYVVTLRDVNIPALLGSLRAIVTRDLQVVAELAVAYPNPLPTPPTVAPATDSFNATPGTYRILVLGTARAGESGGTFGVTVAPAGGGTSIADAVDTVTGDESPPPGVSSLKAPVTIADAGNYELTITDHAFPALVSVQAALVPAAGGSAIVITPGSPFAAVAGMYELVIIATADASALAGLYSARMSGGPLAAVVHQSTNAVGNLGPAVNLNLGAGQYSLATADANFPAALSSFAVAVTQNAALLGSQSGAGSISVTAVQGDAQLFALATPSEVGAYTVRLAQGSQVAYAEVHTADASPDPATAAIYTFAPAQPVDAGNYRLSLEDFAFPLAFAAFDAAVVQGDQIIDRIDEANDLDVVLGAGGVKVLVAVRPPAGTGNALFGLSLAPRPTGAVVFESTQGVGGLFRSHTLQIATAGRYDATLADLRFPAILRSSALAITRGTELIGQIFGGGTVPGQQLSPGTYVLNFLGQPAVSEQYGAYGVKVADSPPVPTVTLTATPASITAGERTTLEWTSTNATSCTAEGGWSGTKNASGGTEQTGTLNANATFDIRCSGPGGNASASASVTVNPPSANRRGGGGGAVDPLLLIYMCVALAACRRGHLRRKSPRVGSAAKVTPSVFRKIWASDVEKRRESVFQQPVIPLL